MGARSTTAVVPLLDSTEPLERALALRVMATHPTHAGVGEVVERFPKLFEEDPLILCRALEEMGSDVFLPLLKQEHRPGEWKTAQVILRLCRIHGCETESIRELEREVAEHEEGLRRGESLFTPGFRHWPDRLELDLGCRRCGRKYTYAVREVHLHPHRRTEQDAEAPEGAPYRNGVVICDDLRCKNCDTLNDFVVTRETLGRITAESLKLMALHRAKITPPPYYPVKLVDLSEPGGKPLSLVELERDYDEAALRHPNQPKAHIVLGKFYEYVKEYSKARRAFLKAVDLDPRALEALAGLARLEHSRGGTAEAFEWIDRCYKELDDGRLYTT